MQHHVCAHTDGVTFLHGLCNLNVSLFNELLQALLPSCEASSDVVCKSRAS